MHDIYISQYASMASSIATVTVAFLHSIIVHHYRTRTRLLCSKVNIFRRTGEVFKD